MVTLNQKQRKLLTKSREKKGLNQTQFAQRLSVTQSFVSYVEAGRKRPSEDLLKKWCRSLGLDLQVEIIKRRQNLMSAEE